MGHKKLLSEGLKADRISGHGRGCRCHVGTEAGDEMATNGQEQ
jgi:hypothetical protein